ncbi:hypothetical protein L207DRAFT_638785 [Hyaloscypha variabilis F]|uniref:Uncharacterized protein n=1 Tax=Hyaloscypha variabilis (strain UAMH 11265 / GT02V1 / F) TaxID=1149755 RepID=A0A2J6R6V5_HYAVF|nr:hypothetical protein L207DRAFT_638785 [Hyaloscypha variabilis F]
MERQEDKNFPISKAPADNVSGSSLSEPEASSRARKNKKKRDAKKAKKSKGSDNGTTSSSPSATPSAAASPPQIKDSSQAASEMNQEQPTPISSDEARLATCQSIIEATQKKILYLRREQFNDIFAEFKQLCEISWGVTKGEILLIGYRDPARAVTLHTYISSFPTEIPTPGLPKTIEIVTKSVAEIFLILLDIITVFSSHETNNPRERVAARKSNEMMRNFYMGKEAEWKRFDVQISGLESTISRFEKEIELIKRGKKWDIEAQKKMLQTEKERTEKVIREMMKEREKCDAMGCPCVEKERLGNLLLPGLGTKARDDNDRQKISEILNGKEPWKEQNAEAFLEDFKKRHFGKNGWACTRTVL